jgi:hypothetical protein
MSDMLDCGQHAERLRRLAIAGLRASLVFMVPPGTEPISEEMKVLMINFDYWENYLRRMLEVEPMIKSACENLVETNSTFKIDKNGNYECMESFDPCRSG